MLLCIPAFFPPLLAWHPWQLLEASGRGCKGHVQGHKWSSAYIHKGSRFAYIQHTYTHGGLKSFLTKTSFGNLLSDYAQTMTIFHKYSNNFLTLSFIHLKLQFSIYCTIQNVLSALSLLENWRHKIIIFQDTIKRGVRIREATVTFNQQYRRAKVKNDRGLTCVCLLDYIFILKISQCTELTIFTTVSGLEGSVLMKIISYFILVELFSCVMFCISLSLCLCQACVFLCLCVPFVLDLPPMALGLVLWILLVAFLLLAILLLVFWTLLFYLPECLAFWSLFWFTHNNFMLERVACRYKQEWRGTELKLNISPSDLSSSSLSTIGILQLSCLQTHQMDIDVN